ncbi:CmpA/NrtA family ABC transporter substrate-binding protein [Reinekea thalattae]|uniref:ABC transporter substrate-binding protein n=1 Tax=Reinekea thalattae TaxID=2593301 RepID=A0A5C8Z5D3_9GAMM|nr:CmpA/NrtA family ABC transporter substrate-binding protein [Reinekea thalattae]TXR52130.1 ABC transporter substrate-binding protein [Reinekea thalattae]
MSDKIELGFIPLLDCAPLIVAQKLGLFEQNNVQVELHKEYSWASLIEKITLGVYQGGHMLTPAIVAEALYHETPRMISPINMGLNGNAITLSHRITKTDKPLKQLVKEEARGNNKLSFGVVYPFSMHNLQLRMWLEQQQVDPSEVNIRVVPPKSMWQALSRGDIDGFCVGEPWNSYSQEQGGCEVVASAHELWPDAPEKSLGLNSLWANKNETAVLGLTRAIYKACEWLEQNIESQQLTEWMVECDVLSMSNEDVSRCFKNPVGKKIYFSNQATEQTFERTKAIAENIKRWHPERVVQDIESAQQAFDLELYRKATRL